LLPGGEGELFDGIHLPNGVRRQSAGAGGERLTTGQRRRLALAAEPALESADAGEVGQFGMEPTQT